MPKFSSTWIARVIPHPTAEGPVDDAEQVVAAPREAVVPLDHLRGMVRAISPAGLFSTRWLWFTAVSAWCLQFPLVVIS